MSVHDRTQTEAPTPWLSRPQSIRVLWIGFAVVLALTVLAQLFVHLHAHFALEALFGFNALYGFLSCVGMVVFAKGLGFLIKRSDDYYGTDETDATGTPDGAGEGDD
ncbi:MAG: hypothetical protein KDJ14_01850 [Xanthomonadales bacterium]|nr:hypothetical protein [Xanthomonadales bacterium]